MGSPEQMGGTAGEMDVVSKQMLPGNVFEAARQTATVPEEAEGSVQTALLQDIAVNTKTAAEAAERNARVQEALAKDQAASNEKIDEIKENIGISKGA